MEDALSRDRSQCSTACRAGRTVLLAIEKILDRNPRRRNSFSVDMFAGLPASSLARDADRCLFGRVVFSGEIVVMPIYEYVCGRCGHQFELLVRSAEKPLCPSCHSGQLERQFSAPAAHSASSANDCPQRQTCPAEHCCGQNCGMSDWGNY